ncbi:MAG: hypothetical protein FWH56_00385 [Betaproteobacteria bacterium]|nr:hypothetical protein [Betaproteobacteria bacterium]
MMKTHAEAKAPHVSFQNYVTPTPNTAAPQQYREAMQQAGVGSLAAPKKRWEDTWKPGPMTMMGMASTLVTVLENENFSSAQQSQALDVFNSAGTNGRMMLVRLAQRQVNDKSALLDTDKNGNTLLHSLHRIATQPLGAGKESLAAEFKKTKPEITNKELLYDIMREAANPGTIVQGSKNTCSIAAIQYMLVKQNPAEYVRIMQRLISEGKVELRGVTLEHVDGIGHKRNRTLEISPGSVERDNANRPSSSRIFQAAVMDFANGIDDYSNKKDRSTTRHKVFRSKSYQGADNSQAQRALMGLFGNFFSLSRNFLELTSFPHPSPMYVSMNWDRRVRRDPDSFHAVVFEKVENGRVYFRNSWRVQAPDGTELQKGPPRRLEDSSTGLESMPILEFQKRFIGYFHDTGASMDYLLGL